MAPADEPVADEDAFLKRLKSLATYADMFSNAAASIDTGRSDPGSASKLVTAIVPGVAKEGLEGFLRNTAATAATLAKEKGAAAHPATVFFAQESAKLGDDDFKNLAKPLRLLVQTIAKAKIPAPQAPRAWAGDKPKRGF
jgi:hypothetical protein